MDTSSYSFIAGIALLLICSATGTAATITISPLQIAPGDTITVSVQGLPDESQIKMDWEIYIEEPGPTFLWIVEDLVFPINLQNASFRITNQNTATNTVTLENEVPYYETRSLTLSGNSVDGIWTAYHGNDFINGSWPVIRNEGTVISGKTHVLSLAEWEGIKRANPDIPEQQTGGPDTFAIPLSISGFQDGRVKFTIQVNGTDVITETVTVGSPVYRTGTLFIKSSPSAAHVYVDGVYYGITPRKVTGVPPGFRTVTLVKEGYADYTTQVQVSTTGMRVVYATLKAASASIRVNSFPRFASVFLDDQLAGTTPATITGVEPGTHTLTLTRAGYQDYVTTVTTTDGETVRLPMIILRKGTAAISRNTAAAGKTGEITSIRFDSDAYIERVLGRHASIV